MLDDRDLEASEPRFDPVPLPPTPPAASAPGLPGDFDFLEGRWHIRHLKRRGDAWDRFEGHARCFSILGGAGSVEELMIPARDFNGLGLRLLDRAQRRWADHWVNAQSGVLALPGQTGSFEPAAPGAATASRVGLFASTYEDQGRTMRALGIWDCIGPDQCRWRQVWSADDGASWSHDWVMHWRRVG